MNDEQQGSKSRELVPAPNIHDEAEQRLEKRYRRVREGATFIERVYDEETPEPVPVHREHTNLSQVVVHVTEDRLRLVLHRQIGRASARSQCLAAGGVLLAVLGALLTTDFHSFLGLRGSVWQALFVLVGALAAITLLVKGWAVLRAPTLNGLVETTIRELEDDRRRS